MATLTIEAIYERGVLRPLRPLELPEHTRVRLTVEPTPTHPLTDCLGIMPDEDAAEMRRIIEQEFERELTCLTLAVCFFILTNHFQL